MGYKKDMECLHCDKFFDCAGKDENIRECLNFVERRKDESEHKKNKSD